MPSNSRSSDLDRPPRTAADGPSQKQLGAHVPIRSLWLAPLGEDDDVIAATVARSDEPAPGFYQGDQRHDEAGRAESRHPEVALELVTQHSVLVVTKYRLVGVSMVVTRAS